MAKKKKGPSQQPENSEQSQPSRKELRKLERKRVQERQELTQFCITIIALAVFIGALASVLMEPKLGAGLGIAIAALALSFKFPRYAIYGFIFYLPFSGTVTYGLGGNAILQLAKDAIFFPALFGVIIFCIRNKQPLIIPAILKIPLLIFVTFLAAVLLLVNGSQQLAANGEMPILVGVLGLKALLGYLLLIPCIYYLIRTKDDLYFLLRAQVVLIIVCCALAFIQYFMLRTGICAGTQATGEDLFKASLASRCFVGGSLLYSPQHGQIRLPGTFVAPWQWGWFLISSAFFAFGTAFNDRSWIWRMLGLISMVMVAMMSVLSGQRIALALVPVSVVILLVLTGQIVNLKRFLPIGIGLFLILSFLMARDPAVVNERIDSFVSRWNASPPQAFIMQQLRWANRQQQGLLGRGLGRATNAARIFGRTQLVETYHSKVLYEIGPIGLVMLLILFTILVIATFRAYRSIKEPNLRGYGASMWVFILFISYFPYYYPLDVDPVNVYYWLAAGIVLKLPDIDRQERLKLSLEGDTKRKLSKRELAQLRKSQKVAEFK
ncbi:MAG: hormogonium polysaccharide biosynthesis protein HpsL [Cyanobacteria bacterium P01_F01_bin.86]